MRQWLIVVFSIVVLIIFGLAQAREAAARYEYAQAARIRAHGEAQAMIISAQAESRLHAAQAAIIIQAANLPYMVLGVAVIFGSIILYLVVVRSTSPQQMEIHTIFILESGGSRKKMWQQLDRTGDRIKLLYKEEIIGDSSEYRQG